MRLYNAYVKFVCTNKGQHAPTDLGSYMYFTDERLPALGLIPLFKRPRKAGGARLRGVQVKMDETCPRCGRNARYNAKSLHKIWKVADAAPYVEGGFAHDVSLAGHC